MRVDLLNSNTLTIPLAENSVHCVVTSPPYYGLRDYSISGQLGLEPTLQEYIDNTIKWCTEVWRVLRDDGTFWLNLGDSYAGGGKGGNQEKFKHDHSKDINSGKVPVGFKQKDLMLVPHRVAIALQEWGWWVRSDTIENVEFYCPCGCGYILEERIWRYSQDRDFIWHKPNPMPESVTDRPTKSHEYIFLLTKNKKYYYDADAIREGKAESTTQDSRGNENGHRRDRQFPGSPSVGGTNLGGPTGARNKRTVWTITTKPYKGAHFATFPPKLPEICIKAGTSEKGVCPVCGSPWERVTDNRLVPTKKAAKTFIYDERDKLGHETNDQASNRQRDGHKSGYITAVNTLGWKPTCSHDEAPVPAIVLDPFGGSGTTAMVANQLGRHGISLNLSWEYLQLAKKRCGITALDEWESGRKAEANLEGLPMFEAPNA